ncbi:MAG: endonuclease III [SAR202 cluster bacterium]|nr:endonuclease III [SAR202 cluster bacterium]
MPATSVKKRAPRTKSKADIAQTIKLMTEQYGPFNDEPRLPPMDEMVFTILSQHTSDINSSRAFRLLMERFGTLEAVAAAEIPDIEKAIAPGGLARIKAPRIKEVLNKVLELNDSLDLSFLREMPLNEAKAWLRQLPGIGPKSAGIVLSFSLGMPAMAIDTHIYRVSQRLGVIGPKVSADKAHDILEEKVEPGEVFNFHVSYINHGRQVCRAQRPKCPECVVGSLCPSRKKYMTKAELAELAAAEEPTLAGSSGAPMPHIPQA